MDAVANEQTTTDLPRRSVVARALAVCLGWYGAVVTTYVTVGERLPDEPVPDDWLSPHDRWTFQGGLVMLLLVPGAVASVLGIVFGAARVRRPFMLGTCAGLPALLALLGVVVVQAN